MHSKKHNYKVILYVFLLYFIVCIYLLTPLVVLTEQLNRAGLMRKYIVDLSKIGDMYKNPLRSFSMLACDNTVRKGFLLEFLLFTISLVVIYFFFRNMEIGGEQSGVNYLKDNGTQGTANWMSAKEADMVLGIGTEKGLVFGSIKDGIRSKMVTLSPDTFFNKNIAVFGASGSMKSRSFVRPNIMQIAELGESMILTDPKAEIFESMSQFLKNKGYNVKALNLVNMVNSDRWNPLNEVTDDISAQSFAETVMANTKAPGARQDEFWDKTEMNLLKALVLYVVKENPKEERNLSAVYSMLALNDPSTIDAVFGALSPSHAAKMPYNIYSQASENVRTGVVIGLGSKLQVFQNKLVQDLTCKSDINLTLPKKEKCAYFCITSDMESTFDFIAGLFFSFLFIKLVKYADYAVKEGQKDVYFILDEFPNIGAIPDFTKKISTMRSRGISSCVIFQNIAQLKNRYPNDGWSEIIGNCDSRLFLGATDIITAEFVSKLLGTATVNDVSLSKSAGFEGMMDFGKITNRTVKRNLMNPDEILRLPNEKEILILRGQKPLILDKMDYTKHRLSKFMRPIKVSDYKPEWTQKYFEEIDKKSVRDTVSESSNNLESDNPDDEELPIEEYQSTEPKNKTNRKSNFW
ncbi:conjugal transfer protein TraG [Clostridium sp. CT7]|uniref:VirD4-like conjugal transfer protein, CD1115 family n=2 Tax=Clostridium TaxID=1485 RepID=UPI000825897B|nr:type IV secretory system conjugative DNA transfer family protein [Clostridium sp. CT7]PJI10416.1 conjugal transfer protein TraG [Clostridium sp. CT7]